MFRGRCVGAGAVFAYKRRLYGHHHAVNVTSKEEESGWRKMQGSTSEAFGRGKCDAYALSRALHQDIGCCTEDGPARQPAGRPPPARRLFSVAPKRGFDEAEAIS